MPAIIAPSRSMLKSISRKESLKILLIICIISVSAIINCYSQIVKSGSSDHFILYLKLPAGISKSDILSGNQRAKEELYQFSKLQLNDLLKDSLNRYIDFVVVHVDQNGTPILPDKEKRKTHTGQFLRPSANELSYTFNSPNQPWTPAQITTLNTFANDFYPKIKSYGWEPILQYNSKRSA